MVMLLAMQVSAKETYKIEQYRSICTEVGQKYEIRPEIIMAIIERESSCDTDAVSASGEHKGLMQLSERYFGGEGIDLFDAETNIRIGTEQLSKLQDRYGDMAAVLMAYHGEKDVRKKSDEGRISQYALWIINRAAELEEVDD